MSAPRAFIISSCGQWPFALPSHEICASTFPTLRQGHIVFKEGAVTASSVMRLYA